MTKLGFAWKKKILIFLASLVALLAAIAAGAGLLLSVNSAPFEFTTVRGQTAQIYGGGIYQFDTLFSAAGYRGQDATALFLGISLLVVAIFFYQRGSLRGQLLLSGMLGYFLYLYVSMALGAAFNSLFLLYIAIFSTSLFTYILSFVNIDWQRLSDRLPVLPRRSLAGFMVASGLITLFVWGLPLAAALFSGRPPDRLDSYTTMVTYALDLAIITTCYLSLRVSSSARSAAWLCNRLPTPGAHRSPCPPNYIKHLFPTVGRSSIYNG